MYLCISFNSETEVYTASLSCNMYTFNTGFRYAGVCIGLRLVPGRQGCSSFIIPTYIRRRLLAAVSLSGYLREEEIFAS